MEAPNELKIGKLVFRINDDNTATVVDCEKDAVAIEVPELVDGVPVVYIGDNAFKGCTLLETVKLPDLDIDRYFNDERGLEEIGGNAFAKCSNLKEITIPQSVQTIGHGAFADCTALKRVEIEGNCPYLYPYAFAGCSALEDITAVDNLNEGLFDGCSSLKTLPMGKDIDTINESCFAHCKGLEEVTISAKVKVIEQLAFRSCFALEKVTFENPNGWRVSNRYSGGTTCDIDLSNPTENARMLKGMDFDDGVVRWTRVE